ncbi:MAG: hypothetical protein ACI4RD_03320 [Kiritimatiellia bacterium]
MDDLAAYVLDGLEAALELERELGVRSVELDRSLLTAVPAVAVEDVGATRDAERKPGGAKRETGAAGPAQGAASPAPAQSRAEAPAQSGVPADACPGRPLVFLHDRPLSPAGAEMMGKIVTALGQTAESAPIVVTPPVPKARVVVVLGARALKLYYPRVKGEPGRWFRAATGGDVLITYSPEYILRFGTVTPAVEKLKREMWQSLKAVKQRLRQPPVF